MIIQCATCPNTYELARPAGADACQPCITKQHRSMGYAWATVLTTAFSLGYAALYVAGLW